MKVAASLEKNILTPLGMLKGVTKAIKNETK